ncbi:PBP1A family penicillin-binding protein [Akkermansiaceae bacterium]|nr:PBP1A family penicillin-binding protein [Akkermansiaceae bacterium]
MPPRKKSAKKKAARKNASKGKKSAEPEFYARSFFLSPFTFIFWLTRNLHGIIRWPLRFFLSIGFLGFAGFTAAAIFYYALASTYDLKGVQEMPARTEILDRNGNILKNTKGQEIGFLHGENRHLVNYEDVSPYFSKALIAREDARFHKHGGVDFRSIGRTIYRAVTRGKLEGGGTITMQLARNSFTLKKPGDGKFKTLHRKALEIAIAYRIESKFSKDEIFEHYMNRIFWGGSIMGIESASRTYFGKSASQLDLSESALLAGIIRAPNAFSPLRDPEAAKYERNTVLDRMVHYKKITEKEANAAKAAPLNIPSASERIIQGTYALDAIRRDLEEILERESIKDGGLIIRTTLDPNIQEAAERSVEKRLRKIEATPGYKHQKRAQFNGKGNPQYLQAATVVIDNSSGGILAIVGGRDATESQFNRALQSRRPVGSIFKPFVFIAAIENGFSINESVSDARISPGEITGAPRNWSPTNSDGKYYRSISASRALIESRNTSSVRVGTVAGLEKVTEIAKDVGFDPRRIDPVPSSYLGSWGATVEEVASAYSIFPNGGNRFRPYYVTSIKDREGKVLWKNGRLYHEAASSAATWDVSEVLEQVNSRGTGSAIRSRFGFTKPSAGKTGTSNDYHDGWYAGYTSALTCAVWVGLDTPKKIISGGEGARLALPIWVDIMKTADRLPSYTNGQIHTPRAQRVGQQSPRALRADPEIPRAIPVNR